MNKVVLCGFIGLALNTTDRTVYFYSLQTKVVFLGSNMDKKVGVAFA